MLEQPNITDLVRRIKLLEEEVESMKSTEVELRDRLESYEKETAKAGESVDPFGVESNSVDDDSFMLLDDEDIKFSIADKKIQILEAYEYYLSESSPLYGLINQAINAFPVLEWVLEEFVRDLLNVMEEDFTKKEILEQAIKVLETELRAWPDHGE